MRGDRAEAGHVERIEPELQRYSLSWRTSRPLKKNMHEIAQVVVGTRGHAWWQRPTEVPFPAAIATQPAASV